MTLLRKAATRSERLFGTLVAVALAIPLMLLAYVGWQSRQQSLQQATEGTRQAVDMLHEHAVKVFETHDLVLHQVDRSVLGLQWAEIERDERLPRILQAIADQSGPVKSIWLADASGRIRASSQAISDALNTADREHFTAHRDSDIGTFISAPFIGRVSGTAVFAVSRRRTGPTGEFDGTIHATVDLGYFESFWKGLAERAALDTAVALIRSDGAILARFPSGGGDEQRAPRATAFIQLLASGDSGRSRDTPASTARIGSSPTASLPASRSTSATASDATPFWPTGAAVLRLKQHSR